MRPGIIIAVIGCALLWGAGALPGSSDAAVAVAATAPAKKPGAAKAPVVKAAPRLSGIAEVGKRLTVSRGTWAGKVTSYGVRWEGATNGKTYRAIRGATSNRLTLAAIHAGQAVRGCIRARRGTLWSAWSCARVPVTVKPHATAAPTVTGERAVGKTLTATAAKFLGAVGAPTRQWQYATKPAGPWTAIRGATGATYRIDAARKGQYVRVVALAKNAGGTTEAPSRPGDKVAAAEDEAPPTAPTVTGGSATWRTISTVTISASGSRDAGAIAYDYRTSTDAGASWAPAIPGSSVEVQAEGETWVQFRARDRAGNVSSWVPAHRTGAPVEEGLVRIDRSAPSAPPTVSGGSLAWRTEPVVMSASGGRDNVKIAGYEYQVSYDDGATWQAIVAGASTTIDSEDQTLIQFRARDLAGNHSAWAPSHLNPLLPDGEGTVRLARVAPELTLTQAADQADPAGSSTIRFTLTATEPIESSSVSASDFTVTGGGSLAHACSRYTCTLTVTASGAGTVSIAPSPYFEISDRGSNIQRTVGGADRSVLYDRTPPTLSLGISPDQASPTRVGPIAFVLESNEALRTSSVTAGDFTVTNGTIAGAVTCATSITCTILVTPTATGEVTIAPSDGFGVTDAQGNLQTTVFGSARSVDYDVTPPALTLAQAAGQVDPTTTAPVRFALTSDEPLDRDMVSAADFDVTNGTVDTVSCLTTQACEVTVAPTASGVVRIAPAQDFAVTDILGNVQTAPSLGTDRAVHYDVTAPTATLTVAADQPSPTANAALRFTLAGSETLDGTSVSAADFTLVNGTIDAITCDGASCTIDATATTAGTVTIAPSGAFSVADLAGNTQTSASGTGRSVVFDNAAPVLTLAQASDQADPASEDLIAFTLASDEPLDVTSVQESDFVATNATIGNITCATNVSCRITVLPTAENVTVSLAPSLTFGVHDALGNTQTIPAGSDRDVFYAPPVTSVTLTQAADQADPTNTATIRFTLTATESLKAATVTAADFVLTRASLSSILCDGTTCQITVTATGQGAVSLQPAAGFAVTTVDDIVHDRVAAGDRTVVYDSLAPTLSLVQASDQEDPTTGRLIRFTLTGSEALDPATVSAEDFSVTNGQITTVSCVETTCELTARATLSGDVSIAPSGAFAVGDALGNQATTASGADRTVTYAPTGPNFILEQATDQADPTNTSPVRFVLWADFDIDPTTVTASDFTITNSGLSDGDPLNPLAPPGSFSCSGNQCIISANFLGPSAITIAPSASFSVSDTQGRASTEVGGTDRTVNYGS